MIRRPLAARRSGAAAVEFAIIMNMILVPMMIGTWEMGRLIFVQQIVSTAAREGARLAAQGLTITDTGAQIQILKSINPSTTQKTNRAPNVKAIVFQTLHGAGFTALTWDDVGVDFAFTNSPDGAVTGATEPYEGVKGQQFKVTVTLGQEAYNKLKWVSVGLVNPTQVSYEANWQMLVDEPFSIKLDIPNW